MLSSDKTRQLVGPSCPLSDEELALLSDQLYIIANTALDLMVANHDEPPFASRGGTTPMIWADAKARHACMFVRQP